MSFSLNRGTCLAAVRDMNNNTPDTIGTPAVNDPKGDLGHGNKTWSPDEGEQGISNRPDDEADGVPDGDEADDAAAFNGDDDDDEEEDEEDEEVARG
jgi:hypothetical protein